MKFLFLTVAAALFASAAWTYEYKEVASTTEKVNVYAQPRFSSKVIYEMPREESAVFLRTSTFTVTVDGKPIWWLEVAVPATTDDKGWVFGDEVIDFSAPEVYEFRVNRDSAVGVAKESLKKFGVGETVDTSNPFVSSVLGGDCRGVKPKLVLISFKQPTPGKG